ncbi:MAG: 3-dehydroquinate synthase [Lachnospiraceae bacterium]|jgi:3-dehydroquinate synthase|nr:3-dehydroquinate synthase [Lachnospiraceae bacterium]
MAERLSVNKDGSFCYDIVFEDSFLHLKEEMAFLSLTGRKLCIVTDSTVGPLYADDVKQICQMFCGEVFVFTFPAGEESKNLNTVQELYAFLIRHHFDRKDVLAALGGGVVGDLTGFAAATYLRGIRFIQIPTTLLSQVDSSIGGKTGVDFSQYKNMVGAFHMPSLVYMNLKTLDSLDERIYLSGMGEVLKSGLIRDMKFYVWLIDHFNEIRDREYPILEEMVKRCCNIKRLVVEKDPTEQGERALLNLGHTIGHAIEKSKDFTMLHGECVALGTVAAAFISWKKEMLSMEEYYEIRDMFVPFSLPITVDDIDPDEILRLTKSDKKMEKGQIKFILLKKVGEAVIDTTVTDEEILAGIREIYFSNEDKHE